MTDEERIPPEESPEIATSTLAEIYAQQGLYDRALAIYRKLLGRNPEDEEIAARIAELVRAAEEAGEGEPDEEPEVAPEEPEPTSLEEEAVEEEAPVTGSPDEPPAVEEDEVFLAWLENR